MSSADALTSLGSDLAFSVSYAIASELRLAAADSGVSDHDLIAAVLVFSIVLSALPASIRQGVHLARREWPAVRRRLAQHAPTVLRGVEYVFGGPAPAGVGAGADKPMRVSTKSASLVEFVGLLISIARRIAMSLLVQLVAATAVARQPLRLSRILSLLSVAVFFLFLQSGASTAIPHTHSHGA